MMRLVLACGAVLITAVPPAAQDKPLKLPKDVTPETRKAIDRGLEFLVKAQKKDGSFGNWNVPVATSSLAGLAFLAGGHTPGRSIKYSENVMKCVDYLLRNTSREGLINEGTTRSMGSSGMHGHGFAVVFLSQVYGMTEGFYYRDVQYLKNVLSRAVKVIENAQAPNGGWCFEAEPSRDEGSTTIMQVQALRAAYNAGIHVNMRTIEKGVEYISRATRDDGLTIYSLTSWRDDPRPTLTAAGMCVLTYLGKYSDPKINKGLDFLLENYKPGTDSNMPRSRHWGEWWYFYGNYFGTLAMYQAGGKYWEQWWPAVRESLIKSQETFSGAWSNDESDHYGEAFGTSFALLTLEIPFRFLPIFQRGED